MYTNDFLAMDFTEQGTGVVFHFLTGQHLAEEYLFADHETAARFYQSCLRLFASFSDCTPVEKEKVFRDFLDSNFLNFEYQRVVY